MRVLNVSNLQIHNKQFSFKSKENKQFKQNDCISQKLIQSIDAKTLAVAMALATMTSACSPCDKNNSFVQNNTTDSTNVDMGYMLRDSAFSVMAKDRRYFYYQLSDLVMSDSAKIEKKGNNNYLVSVVLANKKVDLSLKTDSSNFNEVKGIAKVYKDTDQNQIESVYKFAAKIEGTKDINIQVKDTLNKHYGKQEFLLHRNHNDKLYLINKENNEIIELNKSFSERLECELDKIDKETDDVYVSELEKDILTNIIVALIFGLGIGASLGSKFSNKDDNHTQNK